MRGGTFSFLAFNYFAPCCTQCHRNSSSQLKNNQLRKNNILMWEGTFLLSVISLFCIFSQSKSQIYPLLIHRVSATECRLACNENPDCVMYTHHFHTSICNYYDDDAYQLNLTPTADEEARVLLKMLSRCLYASC